LKKKSILGIALFLLLLPSTLLAYRFVPGYPRWEFKDMPITFYVTYSPSDNWAGRTEQQVKEMITQAFAMWTKETCHLVTFKFGGFTRVSANLNEKDGKNVITWVGGLPGTS